MMRVLIPHIVVCSLNTNEAKRGSKLPSTPKMPGGIALKRIGAVLKKQPC